MVVKADVSKRRLLDIISNYNLGNYVSHQQISEGTVQTTLLINTEDSKYIFRYYENRSKESVIFECDLISYLKRNHYPCPSVMKNLQGEYVGVLFDKPYVVFEFMEGEHIQNPTQEQKKQLIKHVATLQNLTESYIPLNKEYRWNYNPSLCLRLAQTKAHKTGTDNSSKKLAWLEMELQRLKLPDTLPKGVCHCDFHFSNVIFKNGDFHALIDFDDANYTYLTFDLASLIEPIVPGFTWNTWQKFSVKEDVFNFAEAKGVVVEYQKHRTLSSDEKLSLFDVYKLAILFDSIWYFERGNAEYFYEKRKIDYLNGLGRDNFHQELFN